MTAKIRLRRLRSLLSFPPNQIVVGLSVRAVLAVALPLVVLRAAGLPSSGLYFSLGALLTALADSGGPYRDRLLAIGGLSLLLPEIYLLGTQLGELWWLAAVAMFALAFVGGMLRSLGTLGMPLGMLIGSSLLIGVITSAPALAALAQAGWFLGGCAWTVLLTLAAWRLRPYVSLQRQAGAALDAAARLFEAVPHASAKELATRELAVRAALEQARNALGSTREMAPMTNPTLTLLFALLYVPSRLAMIAMDLSEFRERVAHEDEICDALDAVIAELATESKAAARAVIESRPWSPGDALDGRISTFSRIRVADPEFGKNRDAIVEILRAGARRLKGVSSIAKSLVNERRGGVRLPMQGTLARLRELVRAVGVQFSLRSEILRYAMRLAVVASVAMAIEMYWKIPHGIWLTLTVLVVMQPDFGATRIRAVARAGGTLAGVVVAGIVLVTVPWAGAREAAVAVLVFLTVFTMRFRYGLFVACLTPLVVLLLALYSPGQGWDFVYERAGETIGGAALALVGTLLLWPSWAGRRAALQLADAVAATARYLQQLFKAAADGSGLSPTIFDARRTAELAVANSEAALQTSLAEPRRIVGEREPYFQLNAHIMRLLQHLNALGARLEPGPEPVPELAPLADSWAAELQTASQALAGVSVSDAKPRHTPLPDLPAATAGLPHLIAVTGGALEAVVAEATERRWATGPANAVGAATEAPR